MTNRLIAISPLGWQMLPLESMRIAWPRTNLAAGSVTTPQLWPIHSVWLIWLVMRVKLTWLSIKMPYKTVCTDRHPCAGPWTFFRPGRCLLYLLSQQWSSVTFTCLWFVWSVEWLSGFLSLSFCCLWLLVVHGPTSSSAKTTYLKRLIPTNTLHMALTPYGALEVLC